jgi:hypothetical protein
MAKKNASTVSSVRLTLKELQGLFALAEKLGFDHGSERSKLLSALLRGILRSVGKDEHLNQTSEEALEWLKTRNVSFESNRDKRAVFNELSLESAEFEEALMETPQRQYEEPSDMSRSFLRSQAVFKRSAGEPLTDEEKEILAEMEAEDGLE